MTARSVRAFRGAAIAFFGAGLVFLVTDRPAFGLGLFLVGLAFIVRSTREGGSIAQERPLFVALVLAGLILLMVIIAAIYLLPKFF